MPAPAAALILLGLLLVAAGLLWWSGLLGWFGHLPGDIRVVRGAFRLYVPITSMLLVSCAVSGVAWLLRWLGRH